MDTHGTIEVLSESGVFYGGTCEGVIRRVTGAKKYGRKCHIYSEAGKCMQYDLMSVIGDVVTPENDTDFTKL
jgi:hypothetical protein